MLNINSDIFYTSCNNIIGLGYSILDWLVWFLWNASDSTKTAFSLNLVYMNLTTKLTSYFIPHGSGNFFGRIHYP